VSWSVLHFVYKWGVYLVLVPQGQQTPLNL